MTPSYYDMTCTPASVDPVLPIGCVSFPLSELYEDYTNKGLLQRCVHSTCVRMKKAVRIVSSHHTLRPLPLPHTL